MNNRADSPESRFRTPIGVDINAIHAYLDVSAAGPYRMRIEVAVKLLKAIVVVLNPLRAGARVAVLWGVEQVVTA